MCWCVVRIYDDDDKGWNAVDEAATAAKMRVQEAEILMVCVLVCKKLERYI